MGGLFIVAGLAGSLLLAGDLTSRYLLLALGVTGGLTLLGAIDDLVKLRSENAAFPPPASFWRKREARRLRLRAREQSLCPAPSKLRIPVPFRPECQNRSLSFSFY